MRVLIVYKKSFMELHGGDVRALARLEPRDRLRLQRADAENHRTLGEVTAHLAKLGVPCDAVHRGSAAGRKRYDLVVSLGGDGTLFAAARYIGDTPILGINADPTNSLGLWTCADRENFRKPLEQALAGKLKSVSMLRMRIAINGKALRETAFNDVLVAHKNPAAMTRYRLTVGRATEDQRSSGVWVATAAGSTAGIRSAGGRRMPLASRKLQYFVREPYTWPVRRYRLRRGFASRLSLLALTLGLRLWIDGSGVRYDLSLGDRVDLLTGPPLRVLGYDDRRRCRLFP